MKIIVLPRRSNTVFGTYPEYSIEDFDKYVSPYSYKEYKNQVHSVFVVSDIPESEYRQYLRDHYAYTQLFSPLDVDLLVGDCMVEELQEALSYTFGFAIAYTVKTKKFNSLIFKNILDRKEQYQQYMVYVTTCSDIRYEQFDNEVNEIIQTKELFDLDKSLIALYNNRYPDSTIVVDSGLNNVPYIRQLANNIKNVK